MVAVDDPDGVRLGEVHVDGEGRQCDVHDVDVQHRHGDAQRHGHHREDSAGQGEPVVFRCFAIVHFTRFLSLYEKVCKGREFWGVCIGWNIQRVLTMLNDGGYGGSMVCVMCVENMMGGMNCGEI